MLLYYFKLQWKRLYRSEQVIEKHPFLATLFCLAVFVILSLELYEKTHSAPYLYAIIAVLILGRLCEAARNDFLKNTYPKETYYRIRRVENLLLAMPFVLFLIAKGDWQVGSGLLITSIIMALVNIRKSFAFTIPTPFPRQAFEFIMGFRYTFIIIGLGYLLTYIALRVDNFNLGVFSLVVILLDIIVFCLITEEDYFVWLYSMNARRFLFSKIKTSIYCSFLLCLPSALALSIVYPGRLNVIFGVEGVGMIMVIMMLLSKYSAFPGGMSTRKSVIVAMALMMPLLVLYTIPAFYFEAKKQLRMILE